jgi:hypothetical protein
MAIYEGQALLDSIIREHTSTTLGLICERLFLFPFLDFIELRDVHPSSEFLCTRKGQAPIQPRLGVGDILGEKRG